MSTHKYIYWRPEVQAECKEGEMFANVHLLVGYNSCSIADYLKMADELRRTFPQAQDKDLECAKVRRSSQVEGFTILTWNARISKQSYAGWHDSDGAPHNPEYSW